jgi:hypothetical protein
MVQTVAWLRFRRSGRIIAIAVPNGKYEVLKVTMFVEFPFIWLNNSKLVGRRNFFHENCLFCHDLDSTARDGHTTSIPHTLQETQSIPPVAT